MSSPAANSAHFLAQYSKQQNNITTDFSTGHTLPRSVLRHAHQQHKACSVCWLQLIPFDCTTQHQQHSSPEAGWRNVTAILKAP
jgi:hypothetical protein